MNPTVIIVLIALGIYVLLGIIVGFFAEKKMMFDAPLGKDEEKYLAKVENDYPGITAWVEDAKTSQKLQKVSMTNKDKHKVTAYHSTHKEESNGVVLLLHGHNGCAMQMMPLAKMYIEELGYDVLLPNWEHHADSEGDATQMGFQEKEDCAMWIGKAMELYPESSKKHLVLHGISMGAATAMLCAGNENVTEIIDDCGYSTLHSLVVRSIYRSHGPGVIGAFGFGLVNAVRLIWVPAMVKPIAAVSQSTVPMLFIHGDKDKTVPLWMAKSLHASKLKGKKELWITEGCTHTKSFRDYPDQYLTKVRHFLS